MLVIGPIPGSIMSLLRTCVRMTLHMCVWVCVSICPSLPCLRLSLLPASAFLGVHSNKRAKARDADKQTERRNKAEVASHVG